MMNNSYGRYQTAQNMPSQQQGQQQMQGQWQGNERNERTFTTPPQQHFNEAEMEGSMQQILADNIGEYCVIEFLIGTERIMRKQGVLYSVGTSYVTLYDDMINDYIVCDIFSIKFVYFYYPGQRPDINYNVLPLAKSSD